MTRWAAGIVALWLATMACSFAAPPRPRILAGPDASQQDEIARRINERIARPAGIVLDVVTTAGVPDTVIRLAESAGIQLAIVQDDAPLAYGKAAVRGYVGAATLLSPLRFVAPLHSEAIYFIVRADSPFHSVHDIESARINIGPPGSSGSMTVPLVFQLLFSKSISEQQVSQWPSETALIRLLTDRSVDVVAFVGTAQHKVLVDMKPDARKFVRLLPFDPGHSSAAAALSAYRSAILRASDYPNLLQADIPALSVQISLVAADRGMDDAQWSRLALSWCRAAESSNVSNEERASGNSPWPTFEVFARELKACRSSVPIPAVPCSAEDRSLFLCPR